jgi:hypothetical protein
VKAGYKFITRKFRPGAQLDTDVNWSAVWRIRTPPKTKHVLWRICKGCTATRVWLLQRRVDCSHLCPLCNAEPKDELHSFFTCSSIRDKVGNSEFSSVITNITQLLDVSPYFKVMFIRRQTNLVAHTLTKAANSCASLRIFDISPHCIEYILINEMSYVCFIKKKHIKRKLEYWMSIF